MRLIDWAHSKGEYYIQLLQTDGKYKGKLENVKLDMRQMKMIADTKIFSLLDVTFSAQSGQNVLRSSMIDQLHESCVDSSGPIYNPFLTQAFPGKRTEDKKALAAINEIRPMPVVVGTKDSNGQVFSFRNLATVRIANVNRLAVKMGLDGMNKTWTMVLPVEAYTKGTDKYIDRYCKDGMAPAKAVVDLVKKFKSGDKVYVTYTGVVGKGVSYRLETIVPATISVPCAYRSGKAGKVDGKPTLTSTVQFAGKGRQITMFLRPEGSDIPSVEGQMEYKELVKALDDMDKNEIILYSRIGGKLWINAVGERNVAEN